MISGVLGLGRRVAENRMLDSCKVTRKGERTWNEETGEWSDAPVVIYEGPCWVKHQQMAPKDVEAGSQLLAIGQLEVCVPVGTTRFQPGDVVEITGSPTRSDQVGRKFSVLAPFDGTQTTALRYRVEVADAR